MSRKYIILLLFFVLQFFCSLLHTSLVQTLKNTAQYFMNVAPIIIFDLFIKDRVSNRDKKANSLVLIIMSIVMIYCIVASIVYMRSSPYALRNLSVYNPNSDSDSNYYLVSIGGGYPLLFAVLLLLPLLISKISFRFSSQALKVSVSIIFIVAILYLFFIAGVTTCLFAVIIGVLLSFLYKRRKVTIVIVSLVLIAALTLIVCIPGLLESIIDIVSEPFKDNVIIYTRLKEIVPAIREGNRSSSFGMRINCFLKDLSTIRNHPFLGAGFYYGYDYLTLSKYVGWHSEWFDIIAEFGLVMGGMLLYFICKSFKDVYTYLRIKNHKIVFAVSASVLIFMGFLDPILTTNMFLVLFVFLPLYFQRENSVMEGNRHL